MRKIEHLNPLVAGGIDQESVRKQQFNLLRRENRICVYRLLRRQGGLRTAVQRIGEVGVFPCFDAAIGNAGGGERDHGAAASCVQPVERRSGKIPRVTGEILLKDVTGWIEAACERSHAASTTAP